MNILLPHDPVTLLITYGNMYDIVRRHKLIAHTDLKKVMSMFRPDCPDEWIDLVLRTCPRTFHCERDFIWLKHRCIKNPEACTECQKISDEMQVLLLKL
jgi:hypothetical protein